MMKAIIDGMIVLPDAIVGGHILLYEGDRITDIVPRKGFHLGQCTDLIYANGGFVVPGFINEHIHGCAGADTMDENEDDPVGAAEDGGDVLPADDHDL